MKKAQEQNDSEAAKLRKAMKIMRKGEVIKRIYNFTRPETSSYETRLKKTKYINFNS